MNNTWGFLRETTQKAIKAGIDTEHRICRTGLNEYLTVIFPEYEETDWVHDKKVPSLKGTSIRPDYRNEELKLIVEFDGLQHYTKLDTILKDISNTHIYQNDGYKVVRIPYFVQLTNEVVEKLFRRKVDVELFDPSIPSFSVEAAVTPAYVTPLGLRRMAEYFTILPEQYDVNAEYLAKADDDYKTGLSFLIREIEYLKKADKEEFIFLKEFV